MQAENNNDIAITEAKLKDFLSSVLSSEGIVVDIRRTFIEYNGVNRSRVFARHANRMACKGSNEKFVVIALLCYPALQWLLKAQDIDALIEKLKEENEDESVWRMSNIQRILESSMGGCKPQLRLEMRKLFFARCQQLVDEIDEAMNKAVFMNPASKPSRISLAMAMLRGSILDSDPVTASIILQNIMDKYGTAEPEPEPVTVKPETLKKPEQKAESKPPEPTDVESIPDTPHQTKPEASNPAFKPKEVSLPSEPAKASSEPDLPVLDDVSLDTDEAADDTLALDAEIIDEDAGEVSLTADPEHDADAALVSFEQEAALASDDEDDAAALERELAALEATLPTPTTFDPSGIEEDEDDSESFDMDSWLAEDVPEIEPDTEAEIELETAEPELTVEPELEPAETDSEPPAKKEITPKPAGMESDQNGKKDKAPANSEKSSDSGTENPVKVNAFTKQENPVPVEEKPAPKQKPAKASKAKTPKTPESGTSKPATAPAPAPAKKLEADNRNDASLFGRGFQNRTTKSSGGGKKKANQSKKPEPYSEGEQMRFDGI